MELNNEVVEEAYKYDLDLTLEEFAMLRQMGLDLIQKDDAALINYAVIKILEDHVKTMSDKIDKLQKISTAEKMQRLSTKGLEQVKQQIQKRVQKKTTKRSKKNGRKS